MSARPLKKKVTRGVPQNKKKNKEVHKNDLKKFVKQPIYAHHEPLFNLTKDNVASGPQQLYKFRVQSQTLTKLNHVTAIHQRWRFSKVPNRPALRIRYVPSASSIVNGNLAIAVTADLTGPDIASEDVISYVESTAPVKIFPISKPADLSVGLDMLKGTTRDGWFYTGTNVRSNDQLGPCMVYIFQMADITTPADAAAVHDMQVFGEFIIEWSVECIYQRPIPTAPTGQNDGLSQPNDTVPSDQTTVLDPNSLTYHRELMVYYPYGNQAATGATYRVYLIEFSGAQLKQAGVSHSGFISGTDWVDATAYWFGIPVFNLSENHPWLTTEQSTERAFPQYVDHLGNTRERSFVDWIGNKISDVVDKVVNADVSIWSVVRDAAILVGKLFLAGRDVSSDSALNQLLLSELRDAASTTANGQYQIASQILEGLSAAEDLIDSTAIGYSYYGIDFDIAYRRTISQPINITKWVATTLTGYKVFFPGSGTPQNRVSLKSATTTAPTYWLSDMSTAQIGALNCQGGIYESVAGTIFSFNENVLNAAGTRHDAIDQSNFPVMTELGQETRLDLTDNKYFYVVRVVPMFYTASGGPTYSASTAGLNVLEYDASIVETDPDVYQYSNYMSTALAVNGTISTEFLRVNTLDQAGLASADLDTWFLDRLSTDVIACAFQVRVFANYNTTDYSFTTASKHVPSTLRDLTKKTNSLASPPSKSDNPKMACLCPKRM